MLLGNSLTMHTEFLNSIVISGVEHGDNVLCNTLATYILFNPDIRLSMSIDYSREHRENRR